MNDLIQGLVVDEPGRPGSRRGPAIMATLAAMVAPGTPFGPYRIVALLGAGGMGEVYRAHDSRLGRDVALKVLPAHLGADAAAIERLTREARAVAALSHPGILTIYDIGQDGGHVYLVTELLEGETLRRRLKRGAAALASGVGRRIGRRQRPGSGARARDRPPRPEARERLRHLGRRREDPRFRGG